MRNLLTMVLIVFSLGLHAMTLTPVSVTNDKDSLFDSIDSDYQDVSVADCYDVDSFEFYDEFYTGNSLTEVLESESFNSEVVSTFCVNDVGKVNYTNVNALKLKRNTNAQSTSFVYRKSRDGLIRSSTRTV